GERADLVLDDDLAAGDAREHRVLAPVLDREPAAGSRLAGQLLGDALACAAPALTLDEHEVLRAGDGHRPGLRGVDRNRGRAGGPEARAEHEDEMDEPSRVHDYPPSFRARRSRTGPWSAPRLARLGSSPPRGTGDRLHPGLRGGCPRRAAAAVGEDRPTVGLGRRSVRNAQVRAQPEPLAAALPGLAT